MKSKARLYSILIPVFGILLFIILYIIATMLYPGGSQADVNAKGFSWLNNYWCNLLNSTAINGMLNPARNVALAAMIILCLALSFFWYIFPKHMQLKENSRLIIQYSGTLSMMFALFLFTPFHDTVINISGVFGTIALVGMFIVFYKKDGASFYGLVFLICCW